MVDSHELFDIEFVVWPHRLEKAPPKKKEKRSARIKNEPTDELGNAGKYFLSGNHSDRNSLAA